VTEILFGQCAFSKSRQTTVLATDHRPAHQKERDLTTSYTQKHTRIHTCAHTPKYKTKLKQSTRPAHHMSCSPWQVLHLWRAHSPPNPSLMRKLIQNMMGSCPKEDYTCLEWIQPARYPERNMVLPSPTLRCCTPPFAQWQILAHASTFNSKTVPRVTNLCSAAHVVQFQDCPKSNKSVQCSARRT